MRSAALWLILNLVCTYFALAQRLHYTLDLHNYAKHTFQVSAQVEGIRQKSIIYQFAATAPGTYQVMDIGRFVRRFEAFDKKGRRLPVEQVSVNQWRIDNAHRLYRLDYEIASTWESSVEENRIYLMCGSSLSKERAFINGQTVFGYFHGWQQQPFSIELKYPKEWQVGTALERNEAGFFVAHDYDHAVDSPILAGKLTHAHTQVGGADINIYTYAQEGKIASDMLLGALNDMLQAASTFLNGLPVPQYTFLFLFSDKSAGAWEHSYSSAYILKEGDWNDALRNAVVSIAAHEFFHIVTPLNIHSEIIEHFNFVEPTPSQHLWLYEGVTEWASHMMQLRAGLIDLEEFLNRWSRKLYVDQNYFDSRYSLVKLSLSSYTAEGQKQYSNIYYRGALVASLLDIRLLELSQGKKGLREVVLELIERYGSKQPFPEDSFFDILVSLTYPEIGEFIEKYIQQAEPLPIKEYFGKIGIDYKSADSASPVPRLVLNESPTPAQLHLRNVWLRNLALGQ